VRELSLLLRGILGWVGLRILEEWGDVVLVPVVIGVTEARADLGAIHREVLGLADVGSKVKELQPYRVFADEFPVPFAYSEFGSPAGPPEEAFVRSPRLLAGQIGQQIDAAE
jgi:hypothetical protein